MNQERTEWHQLLHFASLLSQPSVADLMLHQWVQGVLQKPEEAKQVTTYHTRFSQELGCLPTNQAAAITALLCCISSIWDTARPTEEI